MSADALVLPLGAMVGTYHDDGDVDGHHHEVRRGGSVQELTDADLAGWAFAHGPPDLEFGRPWTREAVEEHLRSLGMPEPEGIMRRLIDRDLVTEVRPGTDAAATFARSHRVIPTMYGLGNSAEEPWLYGIGPLGLELIQVSRPIFELWAWSHLDEDLWRACETFARLEREGGGTDSEIADPDQVLAGFLNSLHGLLTVQAAYVDPIVRP
jgi:hypothetical protein